MSPEEEEEVDEAIVDEDVASVQSISHNLLLRSTTRLDDIVEEHRKRLKEIDNPSSSAVETPRPESKQKERPQLFADIDAKIQDAMMKIIQVCDLYGLKTPIYYADFD